MFCTNCGKEIDNGSVFCPNCGANVNAVYGGGVPVGQKAVKGNKKTLIIAIAAALAVVIIVAVVLIVRSWNSGLSEVDFVVGGQVEFGHYEQDNNRSNGKEPIVWDVITMNDPGYMLVSHYILDCQPYEHGDTTGSFLDSHICQWLNTEFVSEAFSADELAYIRPMKPFGENEERNVQMLSMDQISRLYKCESGIIPGNGETYYKSNDLICGATDYAIAQGLFRYSGREAGLDSNAFPAEYENRLAKWLLIYHPNSNWSIATQVSEAGTAASIYTNFVTPSGVRPVIWISKDKLK